MEAAQGFDAQTAYAKPLALRALPTFKIPESNLGMGASLGNSAVWIHTKGTGAIERVFLNEAGRSLAGTISLRYGARARELSADIAEYGSQGGAAPYSALYPQTGTRLFEIHPAYQCVRFTLASVLDVQETTFLPLGSGDPGYDDAPVTYVSVRITNNDAIPHYLRIIGSAMLRGATTPDISVRYDEHAQALVAINESRPDYVRILALSEAPTGYAADFDIAATYDPERVPALNNRVDARGDVMGLLQLDLVLTPGEERQLYFAIGMYACGQDEALRRFSQTAHADDALKSSIAHLEDVLSYGRVVTPAAVINHGALWSKVNMRRVMATYPTGCAFTNDPGKYANVVVRDCAWFVYGNDHFLPSFSRDILDNIASRQYESGKLPEYFDAVTGLIEDDGLNINDDTPLYVLAVNHHFRAAGDSTWLRSVYPSVARACRYIISQIDERGLVCCSADDPRGDVWAIAGWRNIIPNYEINGAVTELNALCIAALRAGGHLADNLGEHQQDSSDFAEASQRVKDAMQTHLMNPNNGLYYLNIDVHGDVHTDVTGDQVFPVIMRACDDETAYRIIRRLNCPDFWTAAGLRTVSRNDPRFDPSSDSGLLGGVWPGLTWWFAFAAARYHPEIMVRALRSSFEHYGAAPKINNTIPGQFSEWFDGESLENRGMRLSPWEPPRFLWAAVEGVCGLMLAPDAPKINPLIPNDWGWVGLRNLPYHGSFLSYFLVRERESGFRVYSTIAVESNWDVVVYEHDVCDHVRVFSDSVATIALAREDGMAILLGNLSGQTVHTPIAIYNGAPPSSRFRLRTYNSERGDWEDGRVISPADLQGAALSVEAHGFRLLELSLLSGEG